MLIKTVAPQTKDLENAELELVEYDDAFVEKLSSEISNYYIHTCLSL